ncbi:putative regulator of Ras-like GTPase activity (Roadblock/LC7/MglB family) [Micromonospora pisi]|uniref:Putative regulator of Ras-like GTPase activity (Roadblock/LC7/MglB family) n=1 Tax=Micromonospora pisi TaxID=589240 RepID=A0A495JGP4_9ACTN|nr:roadblock/LC7 domain-containing protein [Micromonospora pisi]RKR87554.1 putative regulator of Ras-like GTPase activity (Roadblock/LC7/MglB family) [Micromonospora pisi]
MVATDNLTRLLDDLVTRVDGADLAMVLSPDGLPLAASNQVDDELGEQVASVTAGLHALAVATGRQTETGTVRQIIVQMRRAYLFIATTRGGAILTVRFDGEVEVGDVAYEVALFAGQAHHHLPVYLEPAPPHPAAG